MEEDPIIPPIFSAQKYNGSHHLRMVSEEFPRDEITSHFGGDLNLEAGAEDGNKEAIYRSDQEQPLTSTIDEKNEGSDAETEASIQGKDSAPILVDGPFRSEDRNRPSRSNPKRTDFNPEEPDEESALGLNYLLNQNWDTEKSSEANDDLNYIDINSFQKKKNKNGSTSRQGKMDKSKKSLDSSSYNMPDNSIRTQSFSQREDRRGLEIGKNGVAKSNAKHMTQMETDAQGRSVLDIDETFDTTDSSEQKFLSLEDVKGIFKDVRDSRILNCGGDEALKDIDDRENNVVYEYDEQALLGRITSGLRNSLHRLSNTTEDHIPTEIAFPLSTDKSPQGQHAINTQVSSLDKIDEDPVDMKAGKENANYQDKPLDHADSQMRIAAASASRSASDLKFALPELSKFERKVSKVVIKQMLEEEARLEKERAAIVAIRMPENVQTGISFLRQKEQTRKELEAEAEAKSRKEEEEKLLSTQEVRNKPVEGEYGSSEFVEENDLKLDSLKSSLRKVFTHMCQTGGNEITLEEYEEQIKDSEPSEDVDFVAEKGFKKKGNKKKKPRSVLLGSLFKGIFSKSKKTGYKKTKKEKKKKGRFMRRSKKSKERDEIQSA